MSSPHTGQGGQSDYSICTGDCVEAMRLMQAGSVDAIITDIPYNEVNRVNNREDRQAKGAALRHLHKGQADDTPVGLPWLVAEAERLVAGSVYVFCGYEQLSPLVALLRDSKFLPSVRVGFWQKTDPPVINGANLWLSAIECCVYAKKPGAYFNRHCKAPVWRGPIERNIDWHPTPKPVWLMRELVTASVPPGGLVLDPYMGSGAVGVAALAEGRRFIGCEINPDWSDRASRRLLDVNLDMFHGAA